ncbi:MAG: pyridoxine 5'-phosphate synthase [Candidatus Omnitrophica bacterium]|nr:pyridoxine 5'-phosphate synthase [Candidatus Omnitrophota bacterium]
MPKLGVNIDHIATLREARGGIEPDPVEAAAVCEKAGADSIVCHLREDRRHINDKDVKTLRKTVKIRLNLEMSLAKDIVAIAARVKPDQATFVPEKRQELTTEGGLDVVRHFAKVKRATTLLQDKGIDVSLFIDPIKKQIKKSQETGAVMVELHTGRYADAKTKKQKAVELKKLKNAVAYAQDLGLIVHAGHGLKYHDTQAIACINGIYELNIGHSIISRAAFDGLYKAVKDMKRLAK